MERDWEKMPARGREQRSDEGERRGGKMNYEKKEREFLEGGKDGEGDAVGCEKGREKRQRLGDTVLQ